MVVGILVALVMFVIGIAVKYLKWYWLIAGYNTMPQKEKAKVDTEGLANFIGNWSFILGGVFFVGSYLHTIGSTGGFLLALAVFMVGVIYMVVKAQNFDHNTRISNQGTALVIGFLIVVSLFSIGLVIIGSLSADIDVTANQLKVSGMYGITQPLDQIRDIELQSEIPNILHKTNGFNAGRVRKGNYELAELGEGKIYLESNEGPYIMIFTKGDFIIINRKDPEETRNIYSQLIKYWDKTEK